MTTLGSAELSFGFFACVVVLGLPFCRVLYRTCARMHNGVVGLFPYVEDVQTFPVLAALNFVYSVMALNFIAAWTGALAALAALLSVVSALWLIVGFVWLQKVIRDKDRDLDVSNTPIPPRLMKNVNANLERSTRILKKPSVRRGKHSVRDGDENDGDEFYVQSSDNVFELDEKELNKEIDRGWGEWVWRQFVFTFAY